VVCCAGKKAPPDFNTVAQQLPMPSSCAEDVAQPQKVLHVWFSFTQFRGLHPMQSPACTITQSTLYFSLGMYR